MIKSVKFIRYSRPDKYRDRDNSHFLIIILGVNILHARFM